MADRRPRFSKAAVVAIVAALVLIQPPSVVLAGPRIERDVTYGVVDGEKLLLDVYQPPSPAVDEHRPAIMLIHGGGWRAGSRQSPSIVALSGALAEAGYVAFNVEYRLVKPNPEGDGWLNRYPVPIDDCRLAVRWVRANAEKYGVDAAKLGACGDSAGGHLVSLLGTIDSKGEGDAGATPSSRVQAVADIFGPVDLTADFSAIQLGELTVQDLVDSWITTPEQKKEASPQYHIDKHTAAFLIIHGAKDTLVPVEQSRAFHAALQKAGRSSEYIEFDEAGHGFQGEDWDRMIEAVVAFFDRELKQPHATSKSTKSAASRR